MLSRAAAGDAALSAFSLVLLQNCRIWTSVRRTTEVAAYLPTASTLQTTSRVLVRTDTPEMDSLAQVN